MLASEAQDAALDRSIHETLNLAWDLLSMLPPESLIRVSEDELAKYHKRTA